MADVTIDELLDRVKRLEKRLNDTPLLSRSPNDVDRRVPPVLRVAIASVTPNAGNAAVLLTFVTPDDLNVDRFEVWVADTSTAQSQFPNHVASSTGSPVKFVVPVLAATTSYVAYVRTVMKNGLRSAINASPSTTFVVTGAAGRTASFTTGTLTFSNGIAL